LAVEVFAGEALLSKLQTQACATYGQMPVGSGVTTTIVNGPFPRRYRWLAGASLGDAVHFLAYPHEVEIIEAQLKAIYGDTASGERRRHREQSISVILSHRIEKDPTLESPLPPLILKAPTIPAAKTKRKGVVTLTGALSDLGGLWEASRKADEGDWVAEEPTWFKGTPEEEAHEEMSPCTEIPDNWSEGHFGTQIPDKDADLHSNPGQN
jgi:hypothetical protein